MTPEHSDTFVTLDKSFKNSVDLENELPHSHPLTHSLFHFRIIVTPPCSKINSSIKPAPASGLDLWGQPVTVTADVRSTISKLSVPFPNKFHPPLRHKDTPALAVNVGGRETCFSVQATDHTTGVFVCPSLAATAHQLIARIASDGLTLAPSVAPPPLKKLLPPTSKQNA